MTAVVLDKTTPAPVNAAKDGDAYDRCPTDGCIEVDRTFKNGGQTARGENYLDWSIFNADPAQGGCGTTWSRDTKQGAEKREKKGDKPPKWVTKSAAAQRYTSMPSQRYQDNYDCVFQKCACPVHTPLWDAGQRVGCNAQCMGHNPNVEFGTIHGVEFLETGGVRG